MPGASRAPERSERGVVLPEGHTGSSLLHDLLVQTRAKFPSALGSVELPSSAGAFKRDYGDVLARFEAARSTAPERVEIARHLLRTSQESLEYVGEAPRLPLSTHLREHSPAPELQPIALGPGPGLEPQVELDGTLYRGRDVLTVAERLAEQHQLTQAALRALRWIIDHAASSGGRIDLRGQAFVVLGAGAELAATRLLLAAGAHVLWIDVSKPDALLARPEELTGKLWQPSQGGNLLEQPREVSAAIRAFAERNGPVHLGLFAYASGASQEWRLGAVMNAIATHLPADTLRSVSMLVSPTTVSTLQPECLAASQRGLAQAATWKSALRGVGLLRAPGYHAEHGTAIARATVSIQGLSYQAAQYLCKLMAAETFALHGSVLDAAARRPLTVSANVAGITRTRSLQHPLFLAAFLGAATMGVRIFDPPATRGLTGLLMLHDLLNPAAPGAAAVQPEDARHKAAALLSQQIHGGIYSQPYVLEQAIRAAGVIGMARRPSLLLGRKSKSG